MNKKNYNITIKMLAAVTLLLAVLLIPISADAEESPVLTVSFPDNYGMSMIYEDGTYGGWVYDWLHEIAKYTGWKYEFVTGDTEDLLMGMADGKYDLMGGMYYLDGYEEVYNYPKYIMGTNYSLLIYPRTDNTIKGYDYNTLNGKKIGVFKNAVAKIERLKKFLSFNNIDCELVYYDTSAEYELCLQNGETDILYGSDVYMKDDYNVCAMIEGEPFYIVTAHDKPELCEQLSDAMASIYSANPNFATELYEKYFPSKYNNSIDFSEKELAFIRSSSPIRIAVVKDQYPLFYEEDGRQTGIIPACIDLITERTGLSFDYVYADTYEELSELVARGTAYIIGGYMNGDPSADQNKLVRTAAFAQLDSVILRNKRARASETGIMAVLSGSDIKPEGSYDSVLYYASYKECLNAVNRGEADYTRLPAAFVEDLYTRDYYANLTLIADINEEEDVTFALRHPVNVTLYSILNKAVCNLSEDELNAIASVPSLLAGSGTVTVKSLLYENPVMVLSVCIGLIVLISVIIILANHYKMKSRVMQVKLEKAEETAHAKSDFLSRMSHEIRTPMNAIIGLTNLAIMSGETSPMVKNYLTKIESSSQFLLALLNDVLDMSKIESHKMKLEIAPFDMQEIIGNLTDMFSLQAKEKQIHLTFDCTLTNSLYLGDEIRLSQVLTNLLSNACKFTGIGGSITLEITEEANDGDSARLCFRVRDTGIGIKEEDRERIFHAFEQTEYRNHNTPGTGLGLSICRSLIKLMGGKIAVKSSPGKGSEFYFTVSLAVCHSAPETKPAEKSQIDTSLAGLRVLLAEDNDINAEIAKELLELQQISVDRASNGREAVDMFSGQAEGYYGLILMDVNMPVMNGLDAAQAIRSMDRSDASSIPILAMTANTFQEDRDRASKAGMNGFLPKPFDVGQLYSALKKFS